MANWSQVPVVFGILAFVYAGHGVFPAIQASMKKPKDFPKASLSSPLNKYQSAIVGTRVTQLDRECEVAF